MIAQTEAMRRWASDVLITAGLAADHAGLVADALIYAEQRGVASHGLIRLPGYVRRIREGHIDPEAELSPVYELGGLTVFDASHAIGPASASLAAVHVAERAVDHGVACAIVRRTNHFGAAGHYANLIADRGSFAIVACNTDRVMAAPGGCRRVLGSNPLAMAAPAPGDERPQFDMATSVVSFGKLMVAAQEDREIPDGWAVDSGGHTIRNASDAAAGALLPAAGPKGFGLAYLIDALVALGGAATSDTADLESGFGMVFVAIAVPQDPGLAADYPRRLRDLANSVRSSGADGRRPLLPGERGTAMANQRSGQLELGEGLIGSLADLARQVGLPLPPADLNDAEE
ncbi:MAG: Ldh family oxidoreductase [Propionibacteriaceae bacterium]|nr:Ldh family oxidoreductase [Propionibacteriaceae bacterium]